MTTTVPLERPLSKGQKKRLKSQRRKERLTRLIDSPSDLSVVQINVKNAGERVQSLKNWIHNCEHRADIICLQDIPANIRAIQFPDHILAFGPNNPELLPPRDDEQARTKKRKLIRITSQYLEKEKLHAVAYLIHKSIPIADWDVEFHDDVNIGLAATLLLRISDDQTIAIHNVYNQRKLVKIPDLLQRVTATGQDFLVGVFNLHHPSWCGKEVITIEPEAIQLADGLKEAGMNLLTTRGLPTYARGSFKTGKYSSTIDLTYASLSLLPFVREWQSPDVPGFGSDHRVIMTTFNLEVNRVPSTYYMWKRANPDKFRACVGESLKPIGFPALTSTAMIDNYARKVVRAFGPAIETLVPLASPPGSKRPKSRPNLVTQRAQNLVRLAEEREHNSGVTSASQQHYKVKHFAQNVIRKERSASFHRMLAHDIAKRRRLYFWARRGASWNKKALMPIRQLTADKVTHRTPDGMARCFRQAMWPDETSDEQQVPPDRPPDECERVPFAASQDLEKSEVKSLIAGAPSGKAAGPDLLAYEGMKMAQEELLPYLHHLFAACLKLGHHPAAFKQACTVMLRKAGKDDYEQPKSWRPVALLPSCCPAQPPPRRSVWHSRVKIYPFAYVDDTYLLAVSNDYGDNCKALKECHDRIMEWADSVGVSFSPHKYHVMHFSPPYASAETSKVMPKIPGLEGKEPETSMRILGVELTAKANTKMNNIARICNTTAGPDMISLRQLYITTVRPILSHGCGAWFIYGDKDTVTYQIPNKVLQSLFSIQNQCLRIVTGALYRTTGRAVNKEVYVEDILVYLERVATLQRARALDTPDHERLRRIRRQGRTPAEFELHPYHALDYPARYLLERANESCRDRKASNMSLNVVRKAMTKIAKQDAEDLSQRMWSRHLEDSHREDFDEESPRFRSAALLDKARWGPHNLKRYRGLSQAQSTILIQCRTGFIALKPYLHKIKASDTVLCDCGADRQTVFHSIPVSTPDSIRLSHLPLPPGHSTYLMNSRRGFTGERHDMIYVSQVLIICVIPQPVFFVLRYLGA
ncbi:hypothetical protein FCIRC_12774 [Fusarium circinatum]|uniref:Endonuclease/exonuclease/phosphatase domain-containing protein n=1 Tax=Fusarium circinatum TaxID=48490 RepID=A0A8H5WG59_FUSCI|nr:hypothetical protein FCIRC_12774 [Fusarium circinatum]